MNEENEENVEKERIDSFKGFVCYTCGEELSFINWISNNCTVCGSNLIGFLSDKE